MGDEVILCCAVGLVVGRGLRLVWDYCMIGMYKIC